MRYKVVSLLAAAISFGVVQVASAADMPTKAPVYKAPVAVAYNWTGFYVGGHFGYGWGKTDWLFPFADPFNLAAGDTTGNNPRGWLGGGQLGFNWQTGDWVFGIEGSWSGTGIDQTFQSPFNANVDFYSKINSVVTATGRIGHTWDRFLVYAKGGYASANVDPKIQNRVTLVTWDPSAQRQHGWTLGVGADYMLTSNLILGLEYDYMDFGTKRYDAIQSNGLQTRSDITAKLQTVTARLSYLFNWAGPR